MPFFDEKFIRHKTRYVLQCALATGTVMVVLLILDAMSNAALIAALGATSFIAFTMPKKNVSKPKLLIGGYVVGAVAGTICFWLMKWPGWPSWLMGGNAPVVYASLSVGLAIFGMVITNTEHPPAAGMALGLVLNEWSALSIAVCLGGVILICLLKAALQPVVRDLL